jgi:hypothetical protein
MFRTNEWIHLYNEKNRANVAAAADKRGREKGAVRK